MKRIWIVAVRSVLVIACMSADNTEAEDLAPTPRAYEAIGVTDRMIGKTVGAGQVYLEAQKDRDDNWLDDGSVDLYFGPEEPAEQSRASNWIKTVPGEGWFTYFRLYAPTEAYFDRSWQMPDFEQLR